ncbi:nitroreductase family protein [Clostridium sp.]|uniref:nitroreductase family protein n=1 Tax=Clostridium sp. TaxID=1506 RepID=UPI003463E118
MSDSNFSKLINERRSANNFIKGVDITKEELNEIFKLVSLAPSCFNLQHTRYLVILDKELKELFRDKACPQYKVHTASAAILVLGDKGAYKKAESLYEPMKMLGMLDSVSYAETINNVYSLYEARGEEFMRDEAIRNGSLSAMMFMLIAKDRGWDTCPMMGFDIEVTKKLFKIPEDMEPVLLITIGKEDEKKKRLRGYRKPVQEFVQYI